MALNISRIIGHRGMAGLAPENTLLSIQKAKEHGLTWVEFDVKLSHDLVPVVFHDDTLERTTNGQGVVGQHSLINLKCLDAGVLHQGRFGQLEIPTLAEALSLCHRLDMRANIEIKPTPGEAVNTALCSLNVIRENPIDPESLLISSYSKEVLSVLQEKAPQLHLGYLADDDDTITENTLMDLSRFNCKSLHINLHQVSEQAIGTVKSMGYSILVHTVNKQNQADWLWSIGVDSLFSDYPLKCQHDNSI